MMNMYMDESGSVHPKKNGLNQFFVIGIMMSRHEKQLRRAYKIFIRKNLETLKKLDLENKMFDKNGKFREIKGSCFNRKMKLEFMHFFCQKDCFKVAYIVLDNHQLQEKFISNKARTFNYLLKLFLINAVQRKYIRDAKLFLHIDERNVKTGSKYSLEDYLNQEMVLNAEFVDSVQVKYYDSAQNPLIQIADVFSNIMYSNFMTRGAYQKELKELSQKEYILPLFFFPPK